MLLTSYKTLVTGSVTGANIRISAVDGTAFIDFSAADTLTRYIGREIEIFDSSLRSIKGWIKAAGTGETLGDELITAWSNDAGYPYETLTVNANGHDIDAVINTTSIGIAGVSLTPTVGSLKKVVFNITKTSGTDPFIFTGNALGSGTGGSFVYGPTYTGANTKYYTDAATDLWLTFRNSGTIFNGSATFSEKQVLTPSATGVTIVSTHEGATYNFASKHASFNYNDTSGYTYRIMATQKVSRPLKYMGASTHHI
jgi:hypothetical protein